MTRIFRPAAVFLAGAALLWAVRQQRRERAVLRDFETGGSR